ncbi:sigma-70 family RNA polymerase sigma factor [Comamonas testosteroni]|uniref:Sigma-70 family RNA polymerase sigma factor n=1 Tax=Comamonas testosteroni TaxID=285 RepID=A0A373FPA6_COMTE|nr:sigma-70 family RNA polymerase sigma factor [Comamonas testosteroni]RGE45189.1 sigma-70 family RNA polymerase sigma factor [Comamonas testosteroni]
MAELPLAQSSLADEVLMQAYAAGDAPAFEQLYGRHRLRLWRYFHRNTGDGALADDLSQDLWFAVVDSAGSYEVRSKFTTWLFTMAHHRLVNHWRRQKPGVSLSADTEESLRLADSLFAASGFEPDAQLDRQLMAQTLLAALAQLPADQRECFLLQVEADMTVADIAQATGVAEETAKSRLRYARSKLRAALEGLL